MSSVDVARHGNPIATFDAEAEKKLRRKLDWYILPSVTILYLMCFVDRANIGNARLAGLEEDLGLTGYDYNLLLTVFYIVRTIPYLLNQHPNIKLSC